MSDLSVPKLRYLKSLIDIQLLRHLFLFYFWWAAVFASGRKFAFVSARGLLEKWRA